MLDNIHSLAINGLKIIPELIANHLQQEPDKFKFAQECETKDFTQIMPEKLFEKITPDLKKILMSTLDNDEEVEELADEAIDLIKAGKTTVSIENMLTAISLAAKKCTDKTSEAFNLELNRIQNNQLKFEQECEAYKRNSAQPRAYSVLRQYNLYSQTTIVLSHVDEQRFENIYNQGRQCTDPEIERLSPEFVAIARDAKLIQNIITQLEFLEKRCKQRQKEYTGKIHLHELFKNHPCAKNWLKSKNFSSTMQTLGAPAQEADERAQYYLYENSPAIYGALMRVSVEALKQPIKTALKMKKSKK